MKRLAMLTTAVLVFVISLGLFFPGVAMAEDTAPAPSSSGGGAGNRLQLQLGLGQTTFDGDLSGHQRRGFAELSLLAWRGSAFSSNSILGGLTGFMDVSLGGSGKFSATRSTFGMSSDSDVTASRASLGVGLCALSDYWARVCLAVDFGSLQLHQTTPVENEVTYGTSALALSVMHIAECHVTFGFATQPYAIQMISAGTGYRESIWNNSLTVGYLF